MRRNWLTALCALALTAATLPAAYAGDAPDPPVLVGLAYSDGALDGANLKNEVGSGYRFGYLDADRTFWQVGATDETTVSVVKTQNVWYGSYNDYTSYSDAITSDVFVGCWHVQLPLTPATYEEAKVAADTVGGFPAWIDGGYQVRLGAYVTQEEAQSAAALAGGTAVGTSAYGVSVVKTGTASILFQFDGGEGLSLAVKPGQDDSVQTETWFKGSRYYGDFQYRRVSGGDLTVSNILPLETYINCVVSREMSRSWPLEALKAQAVCARTYYEINLGRHNAYGFDICSTTHCQAYYGMSETDERTAQAAAETAGLRAWYNGEPAQTYYFSSSGGGTENVRNVWPGNTPIPYLCGVVDPYEATISDKISNWNWSVKYTSTELTAHLQSKGYSCAAIVDVQTTPTPTGNVKTLTFVDANGKSWPFTLEKGVRNFLSGLKSMRYTVTAAGETTGGVYYTDGGGTIASMNGAYAINGDGSIGKITGNPYVITGSGTQFLPAPAGGAETGERVFTFTGSGWGHGVGMSQWGAYAMAQQGKTYAEILTFYYPGIEIR